MLSRIQKPRPCVAHAEIVALDDQVANGGRAHVEPQRLPVIAIIKRNVNRAFSSGEKQTLSFRIFAHHIGVFVIRNAVGDFGPGCAAVASAIDVRTQIVEPQRIDRGVGVFLSKWLASMIETFCQGLSCFGVTSVQFLPPSVVRWIRPSSVPAQIRLISSGEGATA